MKSLTRILGKRFKPGGRGPLYYDCVGVADVVVRAIIGNEAADALPGGIRRRVYDDEMPTGWEYVGTDYMMAAPGQIILTQRIGKCGHVEHHVYTVTRNGKVASAEREVGVCVMPKRVIVGMVVGVYEWRGDE